MFVTLARGENGHFSYDTSVVNDIEVDGVVSVVEGVTTGSDHYENGFIVATQGASNVSAYVEFNGVRVDATDLANDFAQTAAFDEAPFDCNGDMPTIHFDVAPGVTRYPMLFQPWNGTRP